MASNRLYFGDNLDVLRNEIKDESIDLIYLDPPFNSQASYNVLFKAPSGAESHAQVEAFEDTWHWGESAERAFDEVMRSGRTDAAELLRAMRAFLRENDMMAYLTMLAVRLIELHRALKPTGSLYLHCDPTASHYIKILLDAIFGTNRFLNEIVWKRTSAHNDPKRFGKISDRLLFYSKSIDKTFNLVPGDYSPEQLGRYKYKDIGGLYRAENLTAPHFSTSRTIEWRSVHPGADRQWRFSIEELERLYKQGRILLQRDGRPRKDGLKEYLHESQGPKLQDIWTDIGMGPTTGERLGYPTQKPVALLERIISASSNEGDLVLDPFCGCGTTIHAAQKLNRRWIGIDITHLAISLIEKRLSEAFPGIEYDVYGTPRDLEGARDLATRDKYQFQWWAGSLVGAVPAGGRKKGADQGVDGIIYFKDFRADPRDGAMQTTTEKIIVSVKGGDNVGVAMIRDLAHVVERERAKMGLFITLAEPTDPMRKEALAEGYYETSSGGKYLKLQIATVAELLERKLPDLPPADPTAFAKPKRESRRQSRLL